jgi:hypothetical protein
MELVHEYNLLARLNHPVEFGGPYGQRMFFEVTGGEISGSRLNATIRRGGGDWAILGTVEK